MASLVFAVFGMVSGAVAAAVVEYVTYLIMQVPAFTKNQENLSELLALANAITIIGIFESWKLCYRLLYKGKALRIGIVGAALASLLVAFSVTSSMLLAEIYIAKGMIIRDFAVIGFSAKTHPILLIIIFVSCFISIWNTMPKGLREVVSFGGLLGIVENYDGDNRG